MSRPWAPVTLLVVCLGCGGNAPGDELPVGLREAFEAGAEVEEYRGLCDASAAVWVDAEHFLVAGDEENFLRVYRRSIPEPRALVPLDGFLAADIDHPEADIEAVAATDDRIYWLTSHGRSKNAKPRPGRRRFFATRWNGETMEPVGRPYERLLSDLAADERYSVFELERAARRAPKSPGGLNLEGLCAWSDGGLLIGARSPVPDGLALLIPLTNPREVVDAGRAAVFGEPVRLDLDGRGVRALEPLGPAGFLIAAGHAAAAVDRMYFWSGSPEEAPLAVTGLDLNVEGLAYRVEGAELLLVSDDGSRLVGGAPCKSSPDVAERRFRARRLSLPSGR